MHHQARTLRTPALAFGSIVAAVTLALAGIPAVSADPKPTLAEVREKVDELHHQAAEANERYHVAADDLAAIELRVTRAENDVERQTARLATLTSEIGGFAAAAYRAGGVDPTMRALLADDPDEFLSQVSVIDAFAAQQAEQLESVAAERQTLDHKRLVAGEERERQEVIETLLGQEKKVVDNLLAEQERLLAQLTAEERARLEAQRQREREAAQAERAAAAERVSRGGSEPAEVSSVPASGRASTAVQAALSKVGYPYVYAGKGPNSFDCSGFTSWAWRQAGVSLSPASRVQAGQGQRISSSDLRPGDLLFYGSPISHVAMYIGGGKVVHAANPRSGVTIAPAMQAGGSRKPFAWATRVG